jgi:hypothetical protein
MQNSNFSDAKVMIAAPNALQSLHVESNSSTTGYALSLQYLPIARWSIAQ